MMKYHSYKAFIFLILGIIVSEYSFASDTKTKIEKPMVVVIDPGHGGKDPGAMNKGIREKDIVLGIGLKLGKAIREIYPDVKVVFTRSTDVFVPLIERSRIANKSKADLFISLHANHCGTPVTRGTETFVLGLHRSADNLEVAKKENSVILLEDDYTQNYEGFDPNLSESYIMFELVQDIYMDQSLSFAGAIQNQFKSRLTTPDRGVKQAGFLVLRQSSMPSVLVETGFISNQAEANLLNSSEGQQNIAASILEAFRKFKSKNSNSPSSINVEKQPLAAEETTSASTKQKTEVAENLILNNTTEKPVATSEKMGEKKTEPKDQLQNTSNVQPDKIQLKQENNPNTKSQDSTLKDEEMVGNAYYSVQIGANTTPVEPIAANFKGLKEIRREKTDKYFRYYVGKETTMNKITPIWQQIKLKFPQAFIVSFVDGKRIIIDNSINP
jgi:N-acetylmuramoyl-L-alanine amidase